MTIKDLAVRIASEFNTAVEEADCKSFKEMKNLYDWTAEDIRSEIEYMVDRMSWGTDEYGEDITSGCAFFGNEIFNLLDDNDENNYMTYGQFKKMVMEHVC